MNIKKDDIIEENLFTYETNPVNIEYKNNHKMSDEFKKILDKSNPKGTRIVDELTGEVYITQ